MKSYKGEGARDSDPGNRLRSLLRGDPRRLRPRHDPGGRAARRLEDPPEEAPRGLRRDQQGRRARAAARGRGKQEFLTGPTPRGATKKDFLSLLSLPDSPPASLGEKETRPPGGTRADDGRAAVEDRRQATGRNPARAGVLLPEVPNASRLTLPLPACSSPVSPPPIMAVTARPRRPRNPPAREHRTLHDLHRAAAHARPGPLRRRQSLRARRQAGLRDRSQVPGASGPPPLLLRVPGESQLSAQDALTCFTDAHAAGCGSASRRPGWPPS